MLAVLVLLALIACAGEAGAQNRDRRSGPYLAIIDMYRGGATASAVDALIALGPQGFLLRADLLRWERLSADPILLYAPAGAMLHTDAVDALWRGNRDQALEHLQMAGAWADAADAANATFRRRWYLTAGLLLIERGTEEGNIDAGLELLDRGCQALPDDVSLLTVTAWVEERTGLAPAQIPPRRDPDAQFARALKRRYLQRAADRLGGALRADPQAVEPALRLGRIRTILGEHADARRALEPLLARPDLATRDAYTARLFMARLLEMSGDAAGARELYRDAVARVPSAQSGRMGLARLLYVAGDSREAAEIIETSLGRRSDNLEDDPWIEYLIGHMVRAPRLREMLRKAVQQ